MENTYIFNDIENKWRKKWVDLNINPKDTDKEKYYCLDMFPFPSGSGLHVGHWRGYTLSDVVSRYKLLQGYEVLHPMGWDAFGLPAENHAIKMGVHPSIGIKESIKNFKEQLKDISAIYDWDKEINTTSPEYYKWTQWIFLQMYKEGLAYEQKMPLNWCPNCKTVLANEESSGGECERCGTTVTKKMLRQWMLRITKYADRLLDDLEDLNWPSKVKKMQKEWIGKSVGASVNFKVENKENKIEVFTTRPDTLFGATFLVLSPEHSLVKEICTENRRSEIEAYIEEASAKSSVDRMAQKEKTGVFTGAYGINPINNEKVEIWIADYVLADYGTGAIMCVPAHDDRDFEFATKFNLPIIQVIGNGENKKLTEAYTSTGVIMNSDKYNGMSSVECSNEIIKVLEEKGVGEKTTNYKLRDWVFSRQRYWGEPIPLVHCQSCGIVPVDEKDLPVRLPNVEKYEPTNTGESPLADIEEWVNTKCPKCNGDAKRETNTMPQWAGSSWYFLRYTDVNNDKELASKELLKKWMPVDMYVGGVEHAVLHLLYARFYTKFLYDIGVVDFEEPFKRLFNQGMINKNGIKMSKSKGNVVSPDELVKKYGCDSLRLYELFVGPPELDAEWDDRGIEGVSRFINKLWKLITTSETIEETKEVEQIRHKLIYDITMKLENLSLNTAVSTFMEMTNNLQVISKNNGGLSQEMKETILITLSPFAPHLAEELWELIGREDSIFKCTWPVYDENKMIKNTIKLPIQVNGKMRNSIEVDRNTPKDEILQLAKEQVKNNLKDVTIVKEIYVPNRIINFVVK